MTHDLGDDLASHVEPASAGVDALEARLVEAETELAAMCELELALETAIEEGDAARRELAVVKQDVADLRASTSWRITAPLRRASDYFSRRRRA